MAERPKLEDIVRERLGRDVGGNPVGRHFLAGGDPSVTTSVNEYVSAVTAHMDSLAEVVLLIAAEVDKLKAQDASR